MAFEHTTVLLHETVSGLAPKNQGIYVDATFGGGGHTRELLGRFVGGHIYAFDQDQTAINNGQILLTELGETQRVTLIKDNFCHLKDALAAQGVDHLDGIMYDLGVSSPQFDEPERGFSYRFDARLDMRMNQDQELDAFTIVNYWPYEKLVWILDHYGDEKFAKRIARLIEQQREQAPITTTFELVELIKTAIPAAARRTGGHPAKRTFQALRVAVNDELGVLEESLIQALELLKPQGRISVITFQSLEDKVVKRLFKSRAEVKVPAKLPVIPPNLAPELTLVTRKPITASTEELTDNHRSHSARLRIAEKN